MSKEFIISRKFISGFFGIIVLSQIVFYSLGFTFYVFVLPVIELVFMLHIIYSICKLKAGKILSVFVLLLVAAELCFFCFYLVGGYYADANDNEGLIFFYEFILVLTPVITVIYLEYLLVEHFSEKRRRNAYAGSNVIRANDFLVVFGFIMSVVSYPLCLLLWILSDTESNFTIMIFPMIVTLAFLLLICFVVYHLNGREIGNWSFVYASVCVIVNLYYLFDMCLFFNSGNRNAFALLDTGFSELLAIPILIVVLVDYLELAKEKRKRCTEPVTESGKKRETRMETDY